MPGFLSTLRHQWGRLNPGEQADADRLDAWLDDLVTNASTATAAAPVDQRLTAAAAHVHALAAHADTSDGQPGTNRTETRIWEEIMAHHGTPGRFVSGQTRIAPRPARPARFHAPRMSRAATRWLPAFNVAMVLVLLVALVAGVAGFYGHHRSGTTNPTKPVQLAAIASPASATITPTATPTQIETPLPTTIGAPAPAETFGGAIPRPAECTVKPLTIDEVMARLGYSPLTPAEQRATRDAAATRIAEFNPNKELPGSGTPLAEPTRRTGEPGRPPTDAEMIGVTAAHRQLIACIMKRSPLQIWAMIDPDDRYWRDLAAFAIPPFTDPAIVRMELEGFVSGKNWLFPDPTQMLPPLSFETPMVNPDPSTARAYQSPDHLDNSLSVSVTMLYYSPTNPGNSPYTTTTITSPSYGRDQGDGWSYRYNPKLKRWLLVYHSGNFSQQG